MSNLSVSDEIVISTHQDALVLIPSPIIEYVIEEEEEEEQEQEEET